MAAQQVARGGISGPAVGHARSLPGSDVGFVANQLSTAFRPSYSPLPPVVVSSDRVALLLGFRVCNSHHASSIDTVKSSQKW